MNWARTEMVSQAPRHVTIESGVQPEELPGWRSSAGSATRRSLGGEAPGGVPRHRARCSVAVLFPALEISLASSTFRRECDNQFFFESLSSTLTVGFTFRPERDVVGSFVCGGAISFDVEGLMD